MKTYRVRKGSTGAPIEVTAEGWLTAAEQGARDLGTIRAEVEVEVDARVGFVSPRVVMY